jgi:hypothetical protein
MVTQTILARGGLEISKALKITKTPSKLASYVDKNIYLSKLTKKPWGFIEL